MVASPDPDAVARFRRDLVSLAADPVRIGLAVSGGPDSLALLLLAWASFPERVRVATVDHGLRPEAAEEARHVAEICEELGAPHRTLPATVATDRSSLQRNARDARYAALALWASDENIPVVATAHHLDDQAETLMMRLLRGSGVGGLAGVRAATSLPSSEGAVRLVRPLLGWRRSELRGIVDRAAIVPVEDPSNGDRRFDRVAMRTRLASAEWIDPQPLARSAAALAQCDDALDWAVTTLAAARIERNGQVVSLDAAELPAEIRRRLTLLILGGPGAAPRGAELTALLAKLDRGETATLAGFKCVGGPIWRFEPAPPHRRPG